MFFTLLLLCLVTIQAQNNDKVSSEKSSEKGVKMNQILIDRFIVPTAAKDEFLQRMKINRQFIKTMPGFIKDTVYEQTGGEGEFNYVTIAVWKDADALGRAKQSVSEEYKKQNFDMPAFLKRLNIKIDRAIYQELVDQ